MHLTPFPLKEASSPIVDGENNVVEYDYAYRIRGNDLDPCLKEIEKQHGSDIYYLPISSSSAGGGVFQTIAPERKTIIGLQFSPPATAKINLSESPDISNISVDEIIIDTENQTLSAGAAVTLAQLNQALQEKLGYQYRVLGADLTSYTYAQVGSTFMTGGMGPQRRYFSDSVLAIHIYNGNHYRTISGQELQQYAGTYGWSGLVTAVTCQYHQLPKNEIAFVLPVDSSSENLANLLDHFAPYCFLKTINGKLLTESGTSDLILGLEHLTMGSMRPLLDSDQQNTIIKKALQLSENCANANADGLIFVNGYSDLEVEDFLFSLVDDTESLKPTICGIDLEFTEIFNDADEMRQLREAVPYAARTQDPTGRWVYKNHTDANIRLDSDNIPQDMYRLWEINSHYVYKIEQLIEQNDGLQGAILIYGHMNPFGVDPHNRITLACDDPTIFKTAKNRVEEFRSEFYQQLNDLCQNSQSIFIGGEKSADSEHKMYAAFGGVANAPESMQLKFQQQVKAIQKASDKFSWRAFKPYC